MAYLAPHFDLDVFVSYSHGDPREKGGGPLKDWTDRLISKLERDIEALDPEFEKIVIWMDPQIDPTGHWSSQLRAKVAASGILIIVMSKRYLLSPWCGDERTWFQEQVQAHDFDFNQPRAFVIRAQKTEYAEWPAFLLDDRGRPVKGFEFYDPDTGDPLDWGHTQDTSVKFARELGQLRTTLTRRLRELRRARDEGAAKPRAPTSNDSSGVFEQVRSERDSGARDEAAAKAPAPVRNGAHRIYLYAASDSEPARADIDRALAEDGIVPLTAQASPGDTLADWERRSRLRVATAKHCEALALLRADNGDRFVEDLLGIGVDERERIEIARSAPMLCAVLDKTGENLPIDVSRLRIVRFDVNKEGWRAEFRQWLDAARGRPAVAP